MVTVQIRDNALTPDLLYAGLSIDGGIMIATAMEDDMRELAEKIAKLSPKEAKQLEVYMNTKLGIKRSEPHVRNKR